jgi:hypothetical protein
MMQMLSAGGYPCFGEFPAFEPEEVGFGRDADTVLKLAHGKAVKILDPQLTNWPDLMDVRVIWMDRDRNEQARSQVKMMNLMGGMNIPSGAAKRLSQSYGPDTAEALGAFREIGILPLRLRFEDVLLNRWRTAIKVADHIGVALNMMDMAKAVIPRPPQCAPAMDIEMFLCERAAKKEGNESISA